jgi:hypothetical protein
MKSLENLDSPVSERGGIATSWVTHG